MFHQRKVWNDMRVSKWWQNLYFFGWAMFFLWLSLWMGLWIIGSQDLFKTQIHSETNHLLCCCETCNNSTVALNVICSLQHFAKNKHNVVFKIEHNINFSFIERWIKSYLNSWYLGQNQHLCKQTLIGYRGIFFNQYGEFWGITAFMELLHCIIFVNCQLYEM